MVLLTVGYLTKGEVFPSPCCILLMLVVLFYSPNIGSVICHIVKCSKSMPSNRTLYNDGKCSISVLSSTVATSHT